MPCQIRLRTNAFKAGRSWGPLLMAGLLFAGGCALGPREPAGKPVELTPQDLDKASYAIEEKKLWVAWHTKGTRLAGSRNYDEALYCFNQAMQAWPKEYEGAKGTHHPEPTDTILQKAYLFLKMNRPELAVKYFKRFEKYKPFNDLTAKGIAEARAMIEAGK